MKTKKLILGGFVALALNSAAQNVSYNINNIPLPTGAVNNAAFGSSALSSLTTGNHNSAVGNFALMSTTTGHHNMAVGMNALRFNTTGSLNTVIGATGLYSNNGNANAGMGDNVMRNNTSGSFNVAMGQNAFFTNTTGSYNTTIGYNSDVSSAALYNASAIGANSKVVSSNQMILGNDSVNVGIGLSGISPGPQNKLEIRTAVPGSSGLRFRNLTTTSTPLTNPGSGVLSVNANGDVIYVNAGGSGGASLGNYCTSATNPMTGNYQVSTASFDFNFTDDSPFNDKVQVGVPCKNKLPGKFNVQTTQPSDPSNPASSISIYGLNTNNQNNFATTGVNGIAISAVGTGNTYNRGVSGYASGEGLSVGVFGESGLGGGNPSGAGINGAYGGYFKAVANGGTNYGIFATANNGSTNYAGYFDGDIMVTGTPYSTAGGPFTASDLRFKKEIKQLNNATEKLKMLNGYSYKFKVEEFKERNFSSDEQLGLIAQELKEVFPQLVSEKDGYNFVNYTGLIPVLLEGFKEQQTQIEELRRSLNESQKNDGTTGINSINPVETGFQMSQNEPNPFTHETVVKYTLPQTISNAFMAVYDLTGKQITTFPINQKGSSSVTITSEKLAAGIYIYSIVADGKVIDSKRMIVAEK